MQRTKSPITVTEETVTNIISYLTDYLEDAKYYKIQKKLENEYIEGTAVVDEAAKKLYENDVWKARDYLTGYSLKAAQNTFDSWKSLSEYLLVKYIDGNIKKEKDGQFLRTEENYPTMPLQPGYNDAWKKSVIQDTGKKLLVPAGGSH